MEFTENFEIFERVLFRETSYAEFRENKTLNCDISLSFTDVVAHVAVAIFNVANMSFKIPLFAKKISRKFLKLQYSTGFK